MMKMLEAALRYADFFKWSVIPISPGTKFPPKGFEVVQYRKRIASREEIESWYKKNPNFNVGIITGKLSNLFVIDHDKYKPSYSEEIALQYIPDSTMTPIASTPQGGQHQYYANPDDPISIGADFLPAMDYRGEGGYIVAPPSVNGSGKAYEWILDPEETGLAEVPTSVLALINKKINNNIYNNKYIYAQGEVTSKSVADLNRPHLTSSDLNYFKDGRRDEDLFHTAYHLLKSGCDIQFVEQVLERLILSWGEKPDPKWIKAKIESASNRVQKREINFADEVRDFVLTSNGLFLTSDVTNRLQLTSRQEKKNVVNVLLRLRKEGIIERAGQKDGCYRRIDNTIEFMDFANADVNNVVDIRLPLNIHLKTKFFPKAAIVIAGVSGMGKTLFSFNTIAENFGKLPIFYFNSEMGPEALKMKLSYFPIPISEWEKHMKVVDQWDFNNIADKVQPDGFNVIDYLEPEGDKPYNIHGVISAIIKRLDKGTALICIQKKPGATMGTGGIYSIKAATLAVSLEWGKLEIIKNRFREADTTPSLNKINFEVHQGHKFVPQKGGWYQ